MARLTPLDLPQVDEEIRAICLESERSSGTSGTTRTLAHHPPVAKAVAAMRKAIAKESVLDPTLVELVRLTVARRNACQY